MPDAKRKQIDQIISRSLLTSEAFGIELRARLVREVGDRFESLGSGVILEIAREILEETEPLFVQAMVDAELASWVAGIAAVADVLPAAAVESLAAAAISAPPSGGGIVGLLAGGGEEPLVRFPLIERAAESLLERDIVTRAEFDTLGIDARARAFTVAREDSEDAISTIRDVLAETIEQGASLRKFNKKLDERLGASRIGAAHRENVYRTNIQAAFHQAHDELASNPIVAAVFPYQEYSPIRDARTRPEHLALATLGLSGTGIYRKDDPFWDVFLPPWGFQCRCGVTLMSTEAAARHGVEEARRWERTGEPPAEPEHRLDAIPFRPDPDFVGGRSRLSLIRMAAEQSPKGGLTIGGTFYPGGQFIPSEAIAAASPEERKQLQPKKPTRREANSVKDYSTDKFVQINDMLRGGQQPTRDLTRIVQNVDSFLSKSPKRPGATARSFNVPQGQESMFREMFQEGGTISDAAFLSTRAVPTVTDRAAFQNKSAAAGRVVMRVVGKNGVDISALSLNPGEGEVLYPRGTKFKVTKVLHLDNGSILAEVEEIETAKLSLIRMAAVHAPKGGVMIGGKKFEGGEFIPGEAVEKATAEEKEKLKPKAEDKKPGKQTDTTEFKKWFGGSKVVDENGDPLRVHHGTGHDFNKFNDGISWVTPDADFAGRYADFRGDQGENAQTKPLFARAEHPVEVDPRPKYRTINKLMTDMLQVAKKEGNAIDLKAAKVAFDNVRNTWEKIGLGSGELQVFEHWNMSGKVGNASLVQYAKSLGFDSIKHDEQGVITYGVFDPTQIKSATGNRGTFDPDNPDIRMATLG